MTDINSEAKFLQKAYRSFITNHLRELRENDKTHIHPPPAFVVLYNTVIEDMVNVAETSELGPDEMVLAFDIVLRFASYLRQHEINYDDFSPCSCVQIDEEELDEVLRAGN